MEWTLAVSSDPTGASVNQIAEKFNAGCDREDTQHICSCVYMCTPLVLVILVLDLLGYYYFSYYSCHT